MSLSRFEELLQEPIVETSLSRFEELLQEPIVETSRFHEVLSGLTLTESEDELLARQYMEYLLHMPSGEGIWLDSARENLASGFISMVTREEINEVILDEEKSDLPSWLLLAQRVVDQRKGGDPGWRIVAIERYKMLREFLG